MAKKRKADLAPRRRPGRRPTQRPAPTAEELKQARPLSDRAWRTAHLMAAGVPGAEAATRAGYRGKRVKRGITSAEIRRHPEARAILAEGREHFQRMAYAGLMFHLEALLPDEYELPPGPKGRKRQKNPITTEEAARRALSREVLQVAGLLGPDHTPPDPNELARVLAGTPPALLASWAEAAATALRGNADVSTRAGQGAAAPSEG